MGKAAAKICGGEGPFKMLIHQYGDDVGKFIVIEKVKNYVDDKITEVKNVVDTGSSKVKEQTFGEIEMKEKELDNEFENFKQQVDGIFPGGISSLEKLKGQSIAEILSFNKFKDQFKELKETVGSRFEEEKENVYKQVDRKALEEKEKLDEQRPSIPLYDSLSAPHQRLVFTQGEKVFDSQIQEQEAVMKEELDSALQVDNFLNTFQSIVPSNSILELVEGFKRKIEGIMKNLGGGAGGVNLGDIAMQIF